MAEALLRTMDVAASTAMLVATAPLLAGLAIAVKLDSRGPILFRQARVGRDKRPIRTLKLRTMVADADKNGALITARTDHRITRVGRFLRRSKLDELPQLWNVLVGDMSLVGPRPEVAKYVELYPPEWQALLAVRPGLTDLASLVFRDEEELLAAATDQERAYREVIMPLKLELALEGLRRRSFTGTLGVIGWTVLSILGIHHRVHDRVIREARRRIDELNLQGGKS